MIDYNKKIKELQEKQAKAEKEREYIKGVVRQFLSDINGYADVTKDFNSALRRLKMFLNDEKYTREVNK